LSFLVSELFISLLIKTFALCLSECMTLHWFAKKTERK